MTYLFTKQSKQYTRHHLILSPFFPGTGQIARGPARLHRPAQHPGKQVLQHDTKQQRGGKVVITTLLLTVIYSPRYYSLTRAATR
jgi:hypothetical protein